MNLKTEVGSILVSTIFLFPHLKIGLEEYKYETMCFSYLPNGDINYRDLMCKKHKTKEEAAAYHRQLVDKLENNEVYLKLEGLD